MTESYIDDRYNVINWEKDVDTDNPFINVKVLLYPDNIKKLKKALIYNTGRNI